MDLHSRPHRRPAAAPHGSVDDEEISSPAVDPLLAISKPAGYVVQLAASLAELISALLNSEAVPSRVSARGRGTLVSRLSVGLLAAVHAVAVLVAALVVAVVIGVGLVRLWAEEPVVLRHPLHFDYTNAEPTAAVLLGGAGAKGRAVPTGHTTRVSLELLMPESYYNRHLGVFQVTAEVVASNGDAIASSSRPCMLRFRSLPVRLTRTIMMGIPLLVGTRSESQKVGFEILSYKESSPIPTAGIRVTLKPRAGTSDLPQIYEAEMVMKSQLPRRKEIVHNWKWTFYVWVSLYVYMMLLIVLVCYFKPFASYRADHPAPAEVEEDEGSTRERGELRGGGFSYALRRWRERGQGGRKWHLVEGSASSVAGGERSEVIEEDDTGDFAASESSVCVGG